MWFQLVKAKVKDQLEEKLEKTVISIIYYTSNGKKSGENVLK